MEHEINNNNGVKGSFLCRQSSSRWTPTTDQIRILKELYYNDGVRSPSAEQIQRISADLRKYGKIEGKNVFYWFQNHKARERQKKRFTTTTNGNPPPAAAILASHNWNPPPRGFSSSSSSSASASSAAAQSSSGVLALGHVGNYGYGSVTMEKSFRDCSISAGGNSSKVGGGQYNYGWVGFDHTNSSFFDKRKSSSRHPEGQDVVALEDDDYHHDVDGDDDHDDHQEIETLPLFPTHREDMINGFYGGGGCGGIKHGSSATSAYSSWYGGSDHQYCHDNGGAGGTTTAFASLELSLNSFTAHSSNMF